MFVDFVNMFADPTGFFSAAPLWLAFVIPGVITAVPVALVWWRLGCPVWEATFKGGTSIIIGVIQVCRHCLLGYRCYTRVHCTWSH